MRPLRSIAGSIRVVLPEIPHSTTLPPSGSLPHSPPPPHLVTVQLRAVCRLPGEVRSHPAHLFTMAKSTPGRTAAIVCSVLACSTGSVLGLGPPINLRAEGLLPVVTTEEAHLFPSDKTTTDDDASDLGAPIPSVDTPRHDLPGGRSREQRGGMCPEVLR